MTTSKPEARSREPEAGITVALLLTVGLCASAQTLTPVWVETGENGQAIARVVVNQAADCPMLEIDGARQAMALRSPVPDGLKPACELAIPATARRAVARTSAGTSLLRRKAPGPALFPSRSKTSASGVRPGRTCWADPTVSALSPKECAKRRPSERSQRAFRLLEKQRS